MTISILILFYKNTFFTIPIQNKNHVPVPEMQVELFLQRRVVSTSMPFQQHNRKARSNLYQKARRSVHIV